ncbi:MAG: UDP-3-O-(3-hydroxymyristoyl)glucosamine N-acyltransferase [Opitutaceae bacterium]|jgi:UDP-3-O-[3-hydroxymyristoyl] glucosamine N-acyltransferase
MQVAFSPEEILSTVRAKRSLGQTHQTVRGIAALKAASPGDLSFLGNPKYKPEVAQSLASVVLVPLDFVGEPRPDQVFVFVENPSVALAQLCARIEQSLWPKPSAGVHPSAYVAAGAIVPASATIGPLCVVEANARLGERVHLQAQVFVGRGAVLGEDCWLMPGSIVAAECTLGARVRLQSGVVVGSDGFGYEFNQGRHEKVPQIGTVVIGADVEIGANSTLDRARFSRTVVGEGTKIDNLVQVGHNVIIGRHCLVCAQAGISGSTTIEDFVIIGGQAGLAGHISIGRGAKIDGQSGVNTDLAAGSFVKGTPCLPYQLEQRINVLRRKIPDLFKRVDALESHFLPSDAEKSSA